MKRIIFAVSLLLAGVCSFAQPHKVEVKKDALGAWHMYVDGEVYFPQGACVYPLSQTYYGMLPDYGANAARNHRTYVGGVSREYLDNCAKMGMMVHAGLDFKSIRSGYYKRDEARAIAEQEVAIMEVVMEYKDHPAILCWSIGNEFDISNINTANTAQYESIERLARWIHEVDPNHPVTMTITAGMYETKKNGLKNICKSLDFISTNGYISPKNHAFGMVEQYKSAELGKPFVVTEFGPTGWWNHDDLRNIGRYTSWGGVVDFTSTMKEEEYELCYDIIKSDPECIGIFGFLWGNQTSWRDEVKEWYGLLDINGYTYGTVDLFQYWWTGHYPEARAPRIESWDDMTLNGKTATDEVRLQPGSSNKAAVKVGNPSGQKLRYHWRIIKEGSTRYDSRFPDGISGLIVNDGERNVKFTAPYRSGAYRLYIHVYDDVNRKAAYASIPFFVEGDGKGAERNLGIME